MIEPAFPFKLLFDDFLQRCCSICMFNALSRFSLDTLEDVLIKTDPVYTHNTYALTVQKKKKRKKKRKEMGTDSNSSYLLLLSALVNQLVCN